MRARILATALALPTTTLACGYEAGPLARGGYEVRAGASIAPDAATMIALEDGARAELGRLGAAALCEREPCSVLQLDLLAIDERSEGVARISDASAPGGERPAARGVRVVVTGRARLARAGSDLSATGARRASESFGAIADASHGSVARDAAAAIAARKLGAILVDELLGLPNVEDP